jgi:F-type H+-transporting ATPase subunit alpha
MAELTINTQDIATAIRKNLDGFEPSLASGQVGRVVEVGDGIARVSGLPDAAVNEMLQFEGGIVGLALNLDEETIGAVILGESTEIEEGQPVRSTGDILSPNRKAEGPVYEALFCLSMISAEELH